MQLSDFDYHLPPELIAQTPVPRGQSRLMVVHRDTGAIEHRQFSNLPEYLRPGDTLVVNDTRVSARRVMGLRPSGQPVEALLLHPVDADSWAALVKPAKSLKIGTVIQLGLRDGSSVDAEVVGKTEEGGRLLRFRNGEIAASMADEGEAPLPPYIHEKLTDEERYQTVYSEGAGSAAAPTAGLHYTPEMLSEIQSMGVGIARITLHVGVDTFRPVRTENLDDHVMHGEWFTLSQLAADIINGTPGRVIAVGTTSARALESAAVEKGIVRPCQDTTRLFIKPGYEFRSVDALQTNFHLPKSTLMLLISALAGRDLVMRAYEEAVKERYRFFSFGDAMLLI